LVRNITFWSKITLVKYLGNIWCKNGARKQKFLVKSGVKEQKFRLKIWLKMMDGALTLR